MPGVSASAATSAAPSDLSDPLGILTEREREVTHLVAQGLSNKEIARKLAISDGTIKLHLHNIYCKLSIANRTALACLCLNGAAVVRRVVRD